MLRFIMYCFVNIMLSFYIIASYFMQLTFSLIFKESSDEIHCVNALTSVQLYANLLSYISQRPDFVLDKFTMWYKVKRL